MNQLLILSISKTLFQLQRLQRHADGKMIVKAFEGFVGAGRAQF
jgi:hypothetical protein